MDDTTPIVVVTDLDGTLLDHDTYRAGPAGPAVAALQDAGVTVVCCSAKTRAEQQVHRSELGITGPFVVENGAAVHASDGAPADVLGLAYADVRRRLAAAADDLGVTVYGFADMSLDELCDRTGLSPEAAERARARDHTEAFVVLDADPSAEELAAALSAHGLRLQRGARFWTASGLHDKGIAVERLRVLLAARLGTAPLLYGIGDAHNDEPMLAAVDVPLLVQRPRGVWADLTVEGLERLPGVGPHGWRLMAEHILASRRR